MKIVLDFMGDLLIERNGKMKEQICPYRSSTRNQYCGNSCPLFSEPQFKYDTNEIPFTSTVTIELCNGKKWTCSENDFSDNRTNEVDKKRYVR